MRYILLALSYFIVIACCAQKGSNNSFYKPRPKTFTPVNDFAGMLTPEEKQLLSQKLLQYRDSSENVVVIITQKLYRILKAVKPTSWKKQQSIILITGVLVKKK